MRLSTQATTCERCDRPRTGKQLHTCQSAWGKVSYIYMTHAYYGCDTGCCGVQMVAEDGQGYTVQETFEFHHPYTREEMESELRDWAAENGRKDVPVRWDLCDDPPFSC